MQFLSQYTNNEHTNNTMLQLNYNNQSTSTVPIRINSITRFITTMSLHNNSLKKILKLLVTKLQTQYSNIHNYTNTHVITYSSNAILEKITHKIQQNQEIDTILSKLYYSTTICTKLSKIQLSRNTQYSARSKTREIIQTTRQTCTNIQAMIIWIAYQQMYWFDQQYILLPNKTQQAQATIAIT